MILEILFTVLALVLIFIFAINKFSRQIENLAGAKFRSLLARLTSNPVYGTITGTLVTSIIQSSTATTVMTVGLVNAGLMNFTQSIGVIFGANIGTTITSQLIAFNIINVAPAIVILGFLILKFGGKYNIYGKSVFYFGLVFLCIYLITQIVAPLSNNQELVDLISGFKGLFMTILFGIIATTIFQSSSITTSLILVMASSGLIDLYQGIGLMLGSNIGTTSTAILAALPMIKEAKKVAIAHIMFNIVGLILILPFISLVVDLLNNIGGTTANQIANLHLLFNLISATVLIIAIRPFSNFVEWLSEKSIFHIHLTNIGIKI